MTFPNPLRRPISGGEEYILLEFARFLSANMSAASVVAYQSDIRLFVENTPGVDLFRITEAQEDDYLAALHRMGRKKRTIQRKGTAFRYFREFLADAGLRGKSLPAADKTVAESNEIHKDALSVLKSRNVIDRLLRAFLTAIAKDHSRSTIRAYTSDLMKFRDHLRKKAAWQHVSRQSISDFVNEQIAGGLNANSAARLLSTIRSLFQWLQENGYVLGNPALGLSFPRGGKKEPIPSVTDLKMIASAEIPSEFPAQRDLLIFELLYRCGLRVSEISALNISAIDLKRRRLTIQGRQDRSRYVNLPEPVIRILAVYLVHRQDMGANEAAPLVVNMRGGRLTTRSIGRIVERLAVSHKLPEGTHPFSLRHAYALHSLKAGRDVQDIRHDLGISGVSAVVKISN